MKSKWVCTLLILGHYSCTHFRIDPSTVISKNEMGGVVENRKEKVLINYYGDFWFHSPKKSNTLNWNKALLSTLDVPGRGNMICCAHTIMEPYCSSLMIIYHHTDRKNAILLLKKKLMTRLNASNVVDSTILVNSLNFERISYELPDPYLKINTRCVEYFYEFDDNLVRVAFWTIESNED